MWRRYKIKVYRLFHLFPSVLYVDTKDTDMEQMSNKIGDALEANSITFVTYKGVSKSYDRSSITKIIVEQVKCKN